MKKLILFLLFSNFIFSNTLYSSNTFSGISTKKGKAAFGLFATYSNIESYFSSSDINSDSNREPFALKTLNLEYITKSGLEIGLSYTTFDEDSLLTKNTLIGYHFKSKNNKTNGFISYKMGNVEYKDSSNTNINFESLSLGIYSGKGFWYKLEHIEFEQNDEEFDENGELIINKPKNYMSFGQLWNKKGFVVGLSYTAEIIENDDEDENEDAVLDKLKQGDLSFTIGFAI